MERYVSNHEIERLFIAVKLPSKHSDFLKKECIRLSPALEFAKWTHPEDFHITLQFLGDTPKENIPSLLEVLKGVARRSEIFTLQLAEWGTFGPPSSPRVLWTGVSGEIEQLKQLQSRVVSATGPLGFTAEKREYNPHITLARKYRGRDSFHTNRLDNVQLQKRIEESGLLATDWTVDAFVVYATRMHAIPMYEIIEKLTFF